MFDEEGDTAPAELADVWREFGGEAPTERATIGFDDTDMLVIDSIDDGERPTDRMHARASTNGDWPPSPRPPETRRIRRARILKAVTRP